MKVDLTKPIQLKGGRKANYIRDTPDGKRIIEWQSLNGPWYVNCYPDNDVDAEYENVPSPPRKVTVWAVWPDPLTTDRNPFLVSDEKEADDFSAIGYRVTEHEIEEPTP